MNNELIKKKPIAALFVTCLVDLFRPSVAFATIKLLESYGYKVVVPKGQNCCGQPAYNSGDYEGAKKIALSMFKYFKNYDLIIVPSASCAGMMSKHFMELFKNDSKKYIEAKSFSEKTHELITFISNIPNRKPLKSNFKGTITYHDSCSSLREVGGKAHSRKLLSEIKGIEVKELKNSEVCCGFGGTFCVKYPQISEKMVSEKLEEAISTGAETLLSGDMGCLLNIAGRARREKKDINCRHIVEILVDSNVSASIGKHMKEKNL